MKYLRLFLTQEEYDDALTSLALPNVSLIVSNNEVKYTPACDYSKLPLFVEAKEDLTVSFSINDIEYSLDNITWQTLPVGTSTPTIGAGERVYFRASGLTATSAAGIGTFSATGRHNIGGNIMSMLYGADYRDKDVIDKEHAFRVMFLNDSYLISAKNLQLPAMTLSANCYRALLNTCVNLVDSPALPATDLADYCYAYLFKGDTSFTQAPELPATVMKSNCYASMYNDCTNLEIGSDLPATDLTDATSCYNNMYSGCSKLRYLKAMILTPPPNNSSSYGAQTGNWLRSVASEGVFVKNSEATWDVIGDHGIPSGWTVELADE